MPTAPPTWRDLARRAARFGITIKHGRHEARLRGELSGPDGVELRFSSWTDAGPRLDGKAMRAAIAAALEQLEIPTAARIREVLADTARREEADQRATRRKRRQR